MLDRVRGVSLAHEAGANVGVARQLREEHLDRDPLLVAVRGRVDDRHPADPEERVEAPLVLQDHPDPRGRALVAVDRHAHGPGPFAPSAGCRPCLRDRGAHLDLDPLHPRFGALEERVGLRELGGDRLLFAVNLGETAHRAPRSSCRSPPGVACGRPSRRRGSRRARRRRARSRAPRRTRVRRRRAALPPGERPPQTRRARPPRPRSPAPPRAFSGRRASSARGGDEGRGRRRVGSSTTPPADRRSRRGHVPRRDRRPPSPSASSPARPSGPSRPSKKRRPARWRRSRAGAAPEALERRPGASRSWGRR